MKSMLMTAVLGMFGATVAHAQPQPLGQNVVYHDGDTALEGYLAVPPQATAQTPVVLMAPAWMGITPTYTKRADDIARTKGYVVFVADVYGKGVRPENRAQAASLSARYKNDPEAFRQRMRAALQFIEQQRHVTASQVAAIGFCFGGNAVLELARTGVKLAGVATFHGGLATAEPATAGAIHTPLLIMHGADDPFVNEAEVAGFENEMKASGFTDWRLIEYGGAVHSFTDPEAGDDAASGAAYNPTVAAKAFQELDGFLAHVFAKEDGK